MERMKTLADYIRWRAPTNPPTPTPGDEDDPDEWRPPVMPVMYDKPQTDLYSPLDYDPIVKRVFYEPRGPAPQAMPWARNPGFRFCSGVFVGAVFVWCFILPPLGRKQIHDLVFYDPSYFPEHAHLRPSPNARLDRPLEGKW